MTTFGIPTTVDFDLKPFTTEITYSPSITSKAPIGHCQDEPGTLGWKMYQTQRKKNLEDLKEQRVKNARIQGEIQRLNSRSTHHSNHDVFLSPGTPMGKPIKKTVRFSRPEVLPSPKFSNEGLESLDRVRARLRAARLTSVIAPQPPKDRFPRAKSSGAIKNTQSNKFGNKKGRSKTVATSRNIKVPIPVPSTVSSTVSGKGRKSKSKLAKKTSTPKTPKPSIALMAGFAETSIPLPRSQPEPFEKAFTLQELKFKKPPKLDFIPNTPHPGSPEWDEYWKKYHLAINTYDEEMSEFTKGLREYNDILEGYRQEAKRITNEERAFKAGLEKVGSTGGFLPIQPPPMRRVDIGVDPIVFNGYVISCKRIQGTISNQLGLETGIEVQVNVGPHDSDALLVERDNHFFTMSFGKKHFIHICVPTGKSPDDLVMHKPIGGVVTIEGP